MMTNNIKSRTKNIKLAVNILLLLSLLFALSGCMSPQERNGVSPLPQNRPASWESGRSMGGGLF
jgi:hypothetical protein